QRRHDHLSHAGRHGGADLFQRGDLPLRRGPGEQTGQGGPGGLPDHLSQLQGDGARNLSQLNPLLSSPPIYSGCLQLYRQCGKGSSMVKMTAIASKRLRPPLQERGPEPQQEGMIMNDDRQLHRTTEVPSATSVLFTATLSLATMFGTLWTLTAE